LFCSELLCVSIPLRKVSRRPKNYGPKGGKEVSIPLRKVSRLVAVGDLLLNTVVSIPLRKVSRGRALARNGRFDSFPSL